MLDSLNVFGENGLHFCDLPHMSLMLLESSCALPLLRVQKLYVIVSLDINLSLHLLDLELHTMYFVPK